MQRWTVSLMVLGTVACATTVALSAPEREPLKPRVPAGQMESAKTLSTPLFKEAKQAPRSLVEEGKILYETKGTCNNCHGKGGKGDGPVGTMLDPGARDFTNCAFQAKRTDGELFWTMKHGVPGTSMPSFTPGIFSEEEAWKVVAYVRTFCGTL